MEQTVWLFGYLEKSGGVEPLSIKIRQVKGNMNKLRKDEFRKLIEILKRLGFESDEIVEILLIIES